MTGSMIRHLRIERKEDLRDLDIRDLLRLAVMPWKKPPGSDQRRLDLESHQGTRTEGVAEGDVTRVSAPANKDAADTPDVVAGIESVPTPAEKRLKPSREVHRPVRRRNTDIAKVAGAIARRNIHATAEGDGQVRKVATDARVLIEGLQRRLGWTRMLVTEQQMSMHEVADRLNARATSLKLPE